MNESRKLLESYQRVVDVLSPLHAGTGEDSLLPDYDYVVAGDSIVVVDPGKAIEKIGDASAIEDGRIAASLPAGELENTASYRLPFAGGGIPRSILPAAKAPDGKPYLPGSSLKGSLRTLIAQKLLKDEATGGTPLRVQTTNDFGRRIPGQFAGQQVERKVFGEQPRDSALRALRVSDVTSENADLVIAPARTYGREENNLTPTNERIAVEAFAPGARLTGSLTLDRYLLDVSRGVQNGAAKQLVQELVKTGQEEARTRISAEREFVGSGKLGSYYDALGREAESPADNSFLLQISWGSGYDTKSFGTALKTSPDWNAVREQYFAKEPRRGPRAGQGGQGGPPRPGQAPRRDKAFPASRRLAELGGIAEMPFGWVRVWLIPAGESIPELSAPPVAWRNEPFPELARPVAGGVSEPGQAAADSPAAAVAEPLSPFARLQALLGGPETVSVPSEAAPLPPIPRVNDRNLKPGTILEAEVVEVKEKQVVVDLGRENPTTVDAAVLGGGNLAARFTVGQRIRLRVLNAPPFFKVRMG